MSFHFALGFFEIFWACFAWNIPQLLFIISLRLEKSKRFAVSQSKVAKVISCLHWSIVVFVLCKKQVTNKHLPCQS